MSEPGPTSGRTAQLHPQLEAIASLIAAHDIPYWLDSGTLIGIMREGDVLAHDKDIDLGMWAEHVPRMEMLVPAIEALGYRAQRNEYDGMRYSYLFTRQDDDGLILSIGVYRVQGDDAWRIALYGTDNPHRRGSLPFYLKGAVRTPLRHLAQFYRRFAGTKRVAGRWPWRHVFEVATWVVPRALITETVPHPGTGLPIPKRAEEYLTYRYGDWRTPQRDWVWYRDDRAVRPGGPEQALGARPGQD